MAEIPRYVEEKIWAKGYPEGVPHEIDIPEKNFVELLDESKKKFRDRVAIIFYGRKYTYGELLDRSDRFATALHKLGVGKDDTVAIYMASSPHWVIASFGAMKIGSRITGIDTLIAPREVMYQVNDSEADTIVIHDRHYPTLEQVMGNTDLENVIVENLMGKTPDVEEGGGVYHMQKLIEEHEPAPPEVRIKPDDIAVLQYTGGVTGRPKGCMLTHANIVSNVMQNLVFYNYVARKEGVESLTALCALPWFHIFGQTCEVYTGAAAGATGVIIPDFIPEDVMEAIQKYKCQVFLGVPTMFLILANHPRFEEYDLSSLRWVISGAAPLPREVYKRFKEVHGITITQGYGLSETSPVTHLSPPYAELKENRGVLTLGLCSPNTYCGIIDPEKGDFLPPGEIGEIVVSGPQVMEGYWKRPEWTEKVFFMAGGRKWLRTGDMGFMDEEGFTYFMDTINDVIKHREYPVYPREVEEAYFEHPAVEDIAAIGVPDKVFGGEGIKAFVVLKGGYVGKITEKDMIGYGKEKLAKQKCPQRVEFVGFIPKTPAGKYLKRKLRDKEIFGEDLGITAY